MAAERQTNKTRIAATAFYRCHSVNVCSFRCPLAYDTPPPRSTPAAEVAEVGSAGTAFLSTPSIFFSLDKDLRAKCKVFDVSYSNSIRAAGALLDLIAQNPYTHNIRAARVYLRSWSEHWWSTLQSHPNIAGRERKRRRSDKACCSLFPFWFDRGSP